MPLDSELTDGRTLSYIFDSSETRTLKHEISKRQSIP